MAIELNKMFGLCLFCSCRSANDQHWRRAIFKANRHILPKIKEQLINNTQDAFPSPMVLRICMKLRFFAAGEQAQGNSLDIGCADQYIKHFIPLNQGYIGLDYYQTATQWYKTKPHVYADAQSLSFADNSIDTVLFLDVMEHLPFPDRALKEIHHVLKPQGRCILQIPFLYPRHDTLLDFQRWTCYGLKILITRQGFTLKDLTPRGKPLETAALLLNIALTKNVLN